MSTTNHDPYANGEGLTAVNQNAPLAQLDQTLLDQTFANEGIVTLASDILVAPTLTGKSGAGNRNIVVAAQSGTADDLIEVTGLTVGDEIILRADTGDTITVKHNDGGATIKIHLLDDSDTTLDEINGLRLMYIATNIMAQVNNVGSTGTSFAILTDEKTTGTDGGTSSAATWNARDLNTEQSDPDSIVSIASDEFTPVSGTYRLFAYAPAGDGGAANKHRLRLFNVTGAAVVQEGQSSGTVGTVNIRDVAQLDCEFTANGTDAYRIDHFTQGAQVTNGLGAATSDGSPEIYLVITLEKE